jgi:type I restriction enzyme S subunit
MRDGWIEKNLEGIADVIMGQSPDGKTYNQEGEGLPFMQGSAEFGEHHPSPEKWCSDPKKIAEPGDLLLSVRAPVGDTNFADQRIAVGRGLSIIRANKESVTEFIRLVIQLNLADLIASSGSGMFASITGKNLKEFKIKLPPLPEQKRIVDLISSVDTYIETLQQQLESAKKSRNAVLHELLTIGCDDWVERKLPEVVEVLDRMRKPINSTERDERQGTIPYYGANGQTGWIDEFIFNEELVLLGEDAIDFADPSARKAYLIQGPSWVNNHAHVLRADKTIINSYFLMESLNKVDYSQYVSFGTRSKLTQASMNGIKVLVPSMIIQEKFVDLLTSFDEVIEATRKSIGDSKVLRSGILSILLSGEHEIPANYDKVMATR